MGNPLKITEPDHAANANNLSISFASLLPKDGEPVDWFLSGAALAIGGREVDLARELGISRATLSGWKSRGYIPEKYRNWFVEELPFKAISNRRSIPGDDLRHGGLDAALHLLRSSEFNPFGVTGLTSVELIEVSAFYFGGLVKLSHFVQVHLPDAVVHASQDTLYEKVSEIVGEAARRALPRLMPLHRVSQ